MSSCLGNGYSLPHDVQVVLEDISFASSLPASRHLNSKTRTYDRRWIFSAIWRAYQGDSRNETLAFLEGILVRVADCANKYPERCLFLAEEVVRLKITCQRLIDFYGEKDNPDITSKLNVFIFKIDEMNSKLRRQAIDSSVAKVAVNISNGSNPASANITIPVPAVTSSSASPNITTANVVSTAVDKVADSKVADRYHLEQVVEDHYGTPQSQVFRYSPTGGGGGGVSDWVR